MAFFQNISISQYHHGNSLLHRLDPRTKLLNLILLIIAISLVKGPLGFIFIGLSLFIEFLLSRLPFRLIFHVFRQMLWLFLSIIILHIMFIDNGTGFTFFPSSLKDLWQGLSKGAIIGCRFMFIILGTGIVTFTTMPMKLADALFKTLKPLSKIGIPVYQFSTMMVIILHFIPIFFSEAEKLILIQKARGANLEKGNVFKRLYNLTPILAPLLKNSFRKADELAIGMESRCYNPKVKTYIHPMSFTLLDFVSSIWMFILIIIIALINIFI